MGFVDHNGTSDRYGKPVSTRLAFICDQAGPKAVGNVPAGAVCTLTLTISNGHKAISAKNSAEAEAAHQTKPLYLL